MRARGLPEMAPTQFDPCSNRTCGIPDMKLRTSTALLGGMAAITLLLAEASEAQTTTTAQLAAKGGQSVKPLDAESLALQRERLELDKQKIASDSVTDDKKLDLEREKVEV